jgi:hypothetical protein
MLHCRREGDFAHAVSLSGRPRSISVTIAPNGFARLHRCGFAGSPTTTNRARSGRFVSSSERAASMIVSMASRSASTWGSLGSGANARNVPAIGRAERTPVPAGRAAAGVLKQAHPRLRFGPCHCHAVRLHLSAAACRTDNTACLPHDTFEMRVSTSHFHRSGLRLDCSAYYALC